MNINIDNHSKPGPERVREKTIIRAFWKEAERLFREEIRDYDSTTREFITLKILKGFTCKQISEKLGVSQRSIMREYGRVYV